MLAIVGVGMIVAPEPDAARSAGVGVMVLSLVFLLPGGWIWRGGKVKQRRAALEDAVVEFAVPRGRIRPVEVAAALQVAENEASRLLDAAIARGEVDLVFAAAEGAYVARTAVIQSASAAGPGRCEACRAPIVQKLRVPGELERCDYCHAVIRAA